MSKKYRVIAKVKKQGSQEWTFVKYHCNDLLSFAKFLDQNFSSWAYFNVFDKATGNQLASFTVNQRPYKKEV